MKRRLSPLLIILVLVTMACRLELTPTPPPTLPPTITPTVTLTPIPTVTETPTPTATPPLTASTGPALLELHMFTPLRGWGVISDAILVTNDGAVNWAQVPLPGVKFDATSVSAYFLSEKIAYFFAPVEGAQIGQLLATRDGGATWQITPTPFKQAKLYFVNDNVGFALQTLSIVNDLMTLAIYQTLDRGTTWTQVFIHAANQGDTNLPVGGVKTGLSFIDPSQGFIGLLAQNKSVGLYHSQDSGRNWVKAELVLPDGLDDYQSTVLPPFFLPGNGNDGFLLVDFLASGADAPRRIFYLTHDAGATWLKGGELPGSGAYFFIDPQNGWASSANKLYGTTDGGQTWNLLPGAFGRSERATIVDFADAKNGWLVTVDTKNVLRMYRSSDGGATWTVIIA